MRDWNKIATSKPVQAYSIFCGVLEYDESILDEIRKGKSYGFKKWEPHVNPGNIDPEEILRNFNRYYYSNFVNCIFPQHASQQKDQPENEYAEKTVRLSLAVNQSVQVKIPRKGEPVNFEIKFEYLDLYFFPHNIVFYCFKCDLSDFSLDDITLINNFMRNMGQGWPEILDKNLGFLYKSDESDNNNKVSFGNKLKVFSMVEIDEDLSREEEDMLLYDLGICAPIGSASGLNPFFQPSEQYYNELIAENKINVFDNWSALALFDTFTGLFRKGVLDNFMWENGYFNLLYLQSLYVKNYLFKTNRAFFSEGSNQQKIEDELFTFNKYYNVSHISYNFLPALMYRYIRNSLAIEDELSNLKEGIERWNQKAKEKRDKMINDVLTIIALLAVFSLIWDLSDWLSKLINGETDFYMITSSTLTTIVTLVLVIFLIRNRGRTKDR